MVLIFRQVAPRPMHPCKGNCLSLEAHQAGQDCGIEEEEEHMTVERVVCGAFWCVSVVLDAETKTFVGSVHEAGQ